jgi:hypothetical protein
MTFTTNKYKQPKQNLIGGCAGTRHGCCPNSRQAASGPNNQGCRLIGGCAGTRYGCCQNSTLAARGPNDRGCPRIIGGCEGTRYGCCPNSTQSASGTNNQGCPTSIPIPLPGRTTVCSRGTYGCVDGSTVGACDPPIIRTPLCTNTIPITPILPATGDELVIGECNQFGGDLVCTYKNYY